MSFFFFLEFFPGGDEFAAITDSDMISNTGSIFRDQSPCCVVGLLEERVDDVSSSSLISLSCCRFIIIFFCFFYTAIVFNPSDTADNLKKHGGYIPGYRPGERTAQYIDYVLTRVTVVGAIYITLVCLLPEFLISATGVPFYFGGTSLLIVVSVTMDTVSQIQGHLLAHQYEGLVKKSKLRGKRR